MIVLVTTATHAYTFDRLVKAVPSVRLMSYPALLKRRRLERATYIFTDFDRLGFWQLELAAHAFRSLQAAGCLVLNDPARVILRLPLLQKLHRTGINSFAAWSAYDLESVDRFPVFLRTQAAHRGNLSELIIDRDMLKAECERLVNIGFPLVDLMIVEYRAQALHADVFKKLSVFRVGNEYCAGPSVFERNWLAKWGQPNVARDVDYADDLRLAREGRFIDVAKRVFETASVDYGRVDFSLVDGKPEFYEINTNPDIRYQEAPARSAARRETYRLTREALFASIANLDMGVSGPPIMLLRHPELIKRGRRRKLWPGYSWLP